MKSKLTIFIFIDALGWDIIQKRDFLNDLLTYRIPVKMQFGYSCTAIPTILTGKTPKEHGHLSFYYFDPVNSPFKMMKVLKFLPAKIFDTWRFRHILSKLIKKMRGYTGYFELYAMPFNKLPYFDYIEKKDLFVSNGLEPVKNLADELIKRNIPYHISNWRNSEEENISSLLKEINKQSINFAFLYTASMDSLLHRVTKSGKEVDDKLKWYSEQIREITNKAKNRYKEVKLFVISDHGMTTLTKVVDVKSQIEKLGLKFGSDYVASYDSTMVHFWFLNDLSRDKIMNELKSVPESRILTLDDKRNYGIDFEDNKYGEEILLMNPGVQIAPSDMGLKELPAMHGYDPEHVDSLASFLGTDLPDLPPKWVGDFFKIMISEADKLIQEDIK